ncbi:MAG: diguanylate cyclase, partial [bacterium]
MEEFKNNRINKFKCEFTNKKVEKDFFSKNITRDLKLIKILMLLLAFVYLFFLIPDYLIIKNSEKFHMILIIRIVTFLLLVYLFLVINRIKDKQKISFYLTASQIIVFISYFFIVNNFDDWNFFIKLFDLILFITVIYLLPNKILNKLFISLLLTIVFFNISYRFVDVETLDFISGIVYTSIIHLVLFMFSYKISFQQRVKYIKDLKLKHLSERDNLTGIYNRNKLDKEVERWIKLKHRYEIDLSIIFLDFDNFKKINDEYGHVKADNILKESVKKIEETIRETDILGRWGGDEFVILLPQTSRKNAKKIVRRINNACKNNKNEILNSSIALGYSIKEKETQNIESIIREAEKWVYKHKLVESQSARSDIISSLVKMLREKLLETEPHSKRIKKLAVKMGRKLNLEDNKIDDLKLLADLHDIGKVGVPNSILLKPASLNKNEWEKVKKHSEIGYRIAQCSPQLSTISDAILYHHEWWDGSG